MEKTSLDLAERHLSFACVGVVFFDRGDSGKVKDIYLLVEDFGERSKNPNETTKF